MASYLDDILPMPITYLQRHIIAKSLWGIASPNTPYPGLNKHIDIPYEDSFKTLSLQSTQNSLYKSLAWVIFASEEYEHLVRVAVMTHAKENTFALREMYLQEKTFHDEADNVYEYLKSAFRKNQGSTAIELYTVANLFKTPLYVFDENDTEHPIEYSPRRINRNIEYDSSYGIMLCAKPDGGQKTFTFRPVTSYSRSNDFSDIYETHSPLGMDSTDDEFTSLSQECASECIVLHDSSGKSSISIPYITVKLFSGLLAEFCGSALETNLSANGLHRLKDFMTDTDKNLSLKLDSELYEFARKWGISSIEDEINSTVLSSSLNDVIAFANEVTLFESMPLYDNLKRLLYESRLSDLKHVHVQTQSECHNKLSEYLAKLIISKEHSLPLSRFYNEPHVVFCFDEKERCFGQYFNGENWCTVFIPDSIKEILPYIESNKYCVIKDKLFFIKDQCTIGEVQLLNCHKGDVTYTKMNECVSNPRIATTSDPNTILLLSNETDRKISEIKVISESSTTISPWRSINLENFKYKFLDKNCISYTIEDYRLALKTDNTIDQHGIITTVANDRSEAIVYYYEISSNNALQELPTVPGCKHILVPRKTKENCKFLALPTKVLSDHISAFY